jgi:lipoprotein-anchoring transpeptidase ErfK/SrfK
MFATPPPPPPSPPAKVAPIHAPSRKGGSSIASITATTSARSKPGGGREVWRVPPETSWARQPQRLLILESATKNGKRWLRVRLPLRHRHSAWIRRDAASISRTGYWIKVQRATRWVTVYSDGRQVRRFRAVVGASATPTPTGLAAIYERVRQPDPHAFLGTWALHLTSVSAVLDNYGGGPGRVAIHGRAGASLADPLGSARSHGCIRVNNDDVGWLAQHVPAGTPVHITRR